MTATATVAADFKDAFYQVAVDMFKDDPDVLVSYGHYGIENADDVILFLGVQTEQATATMSSTNRSREETLTLDVYIRSFRAGEADNDRVPTARVYELLGRLEDYVRTTDTTLGGVVRQCFLTSSQSEGLTDKQMLAMGRQIDCVAQFTALARITN